MTPIQPKKVSLPSGRQNHLVKTPVSLRAPLEQLRDWWLDRPQRKISQRKARLTVAQLMRRVNAARLERLRQRAANLKDDQSYFWTKYLDVEKWLALNIRYAHELGLVENPPRRVLDLGCGGGYFLSVCRQLGARVLGLDLDTDAILNELIAIFALPRLAWNIRPFVKLPPLRGKFDLITAWMICFNLPLDKPAWGPLEWDFLLADLRTHLEPGGRIIFSLNKQLDDGLLYSDELKAYFESLGAIIEGKRITLPAAGLRDTGVLSAHAPRPKQKSRRLFKAVRPPAKIVRASSADPSRLPVDKVVLVDFGAQNPTAASAEAKALFFLAAWRRNVGTPLEMVCIGEPPDTVAWLAERSRARLTVRLPNPLGNGSFLNVARAWEAPGESPRLLLLSSEVLAFGDPTSAVAGLPADSLAAASADRLQVPNSAWPEIYRALEVQPPEGRMRPLRAELDLLPAEDSPEEMWPYYKGEVLLTPRGCPLPERWTDHLQRLATLLPDLSGVPEGQRARLVKHASKIALATALQALLTSSTDGGDPAFAFRRLPLACDGRLAYFEAAADMAHPRLLHVPGLFKRLEDLSQIQECLVACTQRWRGVIAAGASERGFSPRIARAYAAWSNRRLESLLRRLYRNDVRPALRACGAYG